MKKLSKRTCNFIETFFSMKDMQYISLKKHDVRILYDFYRKAINDYFSLERKIEILSRELDNAEKIIKNKNLLINETLKYLKSEKEIWKEFYLETGLNNNMMIEYENLINEYEKYIGENNHD